jgi:hypothetical protein
MNLVGETAEGIISKPQFDVTIFKEGTAIKILSINKNYNNTIFNNFNTNCLIVNTNPLVLTIACIKKIHADSLPELTELELSIEQVVDGFVSIKILK